MFLLLINMVNFDFSSGKMFFVGFGSGKFNFFLKWFPSSFSDKVTFI